MFLFSVFWKSLGHLVQQAATAENPAGYHLSLLLLLLSLKLAFTTFLHVPSDDGAVLRK